MHNRKSKKVAGKWSVFIGNFYYRARFKRIILIRWVFALYNAGNNIDNEHSESQFVTAAAF
jgi:hypothetical protein